MASITIGNGGSLTVGSGGSVAVAGGGAGPSPTVPGAPTIDSLAPGDGGVTIFKTDGSDGGSPITGYQYTVDGGATYGALTLGTLGFADTPCVVASGLTNGTEYTVQIRAVNAAGAGAWSEGAVATPAAESGVAVGDIPATGLVFGDLTFSLGAHNVFDLVANGEVGVTTSGDFVLSGKVNPDTYGIPMYVVAWALPEAVRSAAVAAFNDGSNKTITYTGSATLLNGANAGVIASLESNGVVLNGATDPYTSEEVIAHFSAPPATDLSITLQELPFAQVNAQVGLQAVAKPNALPVPCKYFGSNIQINAQ